MDIRNLLYDFEQAIRNSETQINNGLPRWSSDLPGDRIKQHIVEYVTELENENEDLSSVDQRLSYVENELSDAESEIRNLEDQLERAERHIESLEQQISLME